MSRKAKVVYIRGYWTSNGRKFNYAKCMIGPYSESIDKSDDIFIWFSSMKEFKSYMQPHANQELVITEYKY